MLLLLLFFLIFHIFLTILLWVLDFWVRKDRLALKIILFYALFPLKHFKKFQKIWRLFQILGIVHLYLKTLKGLFCDILMLNGSQYIFLVYPFDLINVFLRFQIELFLFKSNTKKLSFEEIILNFKVLCYSFFSRNSIMPNFQTKDSFIMLTVSKIIIAELTKLVILAIEAVIAVANYWGLPTTMAESAFVCMCLKVGHHLLLVELLQELNWDILLTKNTVFIGFVCLLIAHTSPKAKCMKVMTTTCFR